MEYEEGFAFAFKVTHRARASQGIRTEETHKTLARVRALLELKKLSKLVADTENVNVAA